MSMDFNGREPETPITDQEGVMSAAQPVWDRNRKRKGFGGRKAPAAAAPIVTPEPRSFAPEPVVTPEPRTVATERDYDEPMMLDRDDPMALDRPLAATPTVTHSTLAAEDDHLDDGGLVAPIATGRSTSPAKSSSAVPAAIAAGVIGLAALGATGWYMTRDPEGVPELAAGSITTETAVAPLIPTDPPAQVALNEAPPPPAATPRAEAPRVSAPAARVRPRQAAAAPSASETGVNASTTAVLPDTPQAYAPSPGTIAPSQVNPPAATLPPSSESPAAVPATPPTLPQEPVTEAPTTEITPPQ